MPIKYFIYCRKSTDEEGKQVRSIEDQLTELKDFAAKENLEVVDTFIEKQSAKTPGRSVFNQMLERMEKDQIKGILSWHPDRLARNSVDGGKIIYLLDTGIIDSLKFPTFWFENSSQGKFNLNLSFGQAKYYVDNLAQNIKRGMINKARRGEFPVEAPVGYVNNRLTRKIDVDPKSGRFIKKAFQLYATGKYSYREIGEWLFKKRVIAKNRKATRPHPLVDHGINHMLTNTFYYGEFYYAGEIYHGTHKTLITKKLFDQVQGVMLTRTKNQKRNYNFAFTGLVKCGACGYMITAEEHKKYYRETNRIANYTYYHCCRTGKSCDQPFISQPELIGQVDRIIKKAAIPEEWEQPLFEQLEKDGRSAAGKTNQLTYKLKTVLFKIDVKLDRLLNGFLEGVITKAEYLKNKEKITTDKVKITEKIEGLKRQQLYWLEPVRNHLRLALSGEKTARGSDLDKKREFLKTVGSNFTLKDKKLGFIWQKPFARLTARPIIRSWVDPEGIGPSTLPCHGSVLPVYYGPGVGYLSLLVSLCKVVLRHCLQYFFRLIFSGLLVLFFWEI